MAGPIPASAGEPSCRKGPSPNSRAYPRERGGTAAERLQSGEDEGLSPRARGNRASSHRVARAHGPIPASAGEPKEGQIATARAEAYPRERGGTPARCACRGLLRGLSPRARGNRLREAGRRTWHGPIPASAGEPRSIGARKNRPGAYPRERGGTPRSAALPAGPRGLSPRARGNPSPFGVGDSRHRPIPASAGEPHGCGHRRGHEGAYPRERGGTSRRLILTR